MAVNVSVRGVSVSYAKERVIDDLSLEVGEGEAVALLGPSGCGKTTLLRVIAGLIKQDRGKVFMGSRDLGGIPVNRRNIGFVFQNYSLFPHLTVRGNIEFGLRIKRTPGERMERKVDELLRLIGLEGKEDRRPGHLSGGQQQRVALARALATDPELLLLDEPFGALDAKKRRRIRRELKAILRELKVTALFVTHDQEEAFEVGDRIAVMNKGKIEQIDLPRNLYERPVSVFVADFVGSVNVMSVNGRGESVLVRPEDVLLSRGGFDGVLVNYIFLGPVVEVSVETSGGKAVTSVMPKAEFIRNGFRRGDGLTISMGRTSTVTEGRGGVDGG